MTPKILFIDWNGTISYSRFWEQLENAFHPYHSYFNILVDSLFVKNRPLIQEWMIGKLTAEDICKTLASDTGLDYQVIFDELRTSCMNMQFISEELVPIIKKLQAKGITCVIATDNMDTFDRWTVDSLHLKDIFDYILNSYTLGSCKFNVHNNILPFFNEYLEQHQLSYAEVVLIDDSKDKTGFYKSNGFNIINVDKTYTLIDVLKSFLST